MSLLARTICEQDGAIYGCQSSISVDKHYSIISFSLRRKGHSMSHTPEDLQYTKEHEWVATTAAPLRMRMGITDFAQSALGDIVYVQLPDVGAVVEAGKVCGEVESTKSVSEIFAPISGTIVAVNTALTSAPETLNSDPYKEGWIAEIEVAQAPTDLLTAAEYVQLTA